MNYQVLISGEQDAKVAEKRRAVYPWPFLLFWLNSLFTNVIFLTVSVSVVTEIHNLIYKVLWTLVFCPWAWAWAERWEVS